MKTKSISYPRSGHRLLADLLGYYFNDEYPEITKDSHFYNSERFVYCQKHGHCRRHPCTDPRTNYQKDHDFQLDTPVTPTMAHVIQIRHPINSLTSWFLWRIKIGARQVRLAQAGGPATRDLMADTRASWEAFARQQVMYWKGFVRKWLLQEVPNRVVITYEQLLTNPHDCVTRALHALGTSIDRAAVAKSVASKDISLKNRASEFKYFDAAFLDEICLIAEPELGMLGYRRDSYAA